MLRFFDKNLYGKLTFFTSFTKYFLAFWLRSESIDLWKIIPDFYNNFPDFGGGNVPAFSPPSRRLCYPIIISNGNLTTFNYSLNKCV